MVGKKGGRMGGYLSHIKILMAPCHLCLTFPHCMSHAPRCRRTKDGRWVKQGFQKGHGEHVGFSETRRGLTEDEAKDSHSPIFPLHKGPLSLGTTGVTRKGRTLGLLSGPPSICQVKVGLWKAAAWQSWQTFSWIIVNMYEGTLGHDTYCFI